MPFAPPLVQLLYLALWLLTHLALCSIIFYWLWRWGKDMDERERRHTETMRRLAEEHAELNALIERTSGRSSHDAT